MSEGGVLKGFDDRRHRIGKDKHTQLAFGHHAQGIDDGRGIHPQLHDKREQDGEVAVFRGHGRDQDAKAKAQTCQKEDKGREQEDITVGADCCTNTEIVEIEHYEESDLNAEAQQVAQDGRYGDYHAGKIDLAKYGLVVGEGLRCLIQAVGKIEPADVACQIEQDLRDAIGAHAGDAAKHHHVHDDGQHRLDDIPQRAKNGLFILDDDITLDKQCYQITISPYLLEVNTP